jgi:hypothetical protein
MSSRSAAGADFHDEVEAPGEEEIVGLVDALAVAPR